MSWGRGFLCILHEARRRCKMMIVTMLKADPWEDLLLWPAVCGGPIWLLDEGVPDQGCWCQKGPTGPMGPANMGATIMPGPAG